jgi:hypothetical protein
VSVHVLGMFAPSPATGWLADRVGGAAVAWAGMSLLVLAGVGGAVADHDSGPAMVAVLVVLGLGWNGGSAMLAASVPAGLRPRSEGIGEASMGLAAAAQVAGRRGPGRHRRLRRPLPGRGGRGHRRPRRRPPPVGAGHDPPGGVGGPGGGRDGRAFRNGRFEGVTVPGAFSIGRLAALAALRRHAGGPAAPAR